MDEDIQDHNLRHVLSRVARIERVLQAIADGTPPWRAARAEFPSDCIAPDAARTPGMIADEVLRQLGITPGPRP